MIPQINMNLPHLPISITFLADGSIAISPKGAFPTIIDGDVILDSSGFSVDGVQYEYRKAIDYKEDAKLLEWLQRLNLDKPSRDEIFNVLQSQEMQMRGFGFNF